MLVSFSLLSSVYFNSQKKSRKLFIFFLSNRFDANAFLTVSADAHNRETVMINGSSAAGNTMLEFTNESVIYLGGLPASLTVNTGIVKYIAYNFSIERTT